MTIVKASQWPVVAFDDDGIRPAGPENRCFYCQALIGQPHGKTCVCVHSLVRMTVTYYADGKRGRSFPGVEIGHYDEYVPWSWVCNEDGDIGSLDFARNESSWCASNIFGGGKLTLDAAHSGLLTRLKDIADGDGDCLCAYLSLEFSEVLDGGPFVTVRESDDEDAES